MTKLLNFAASPILRLLSRPKKQAPAADAATVAAIRALCKSPDWPAYKAFLDFHITNSVAGLLSANEDSQCHYLRGYTQGLLGAVLLAENLIQQVDNMESRNVRAVADAARRTDTAKSSLYATSLWDGLR